MDEHDKKVFLAAVNELRNHTKELERLHKDNEALRGEIANMRKALNEDKDEGPSTAAILGFIAGILMAVLIATKIVGAW